jgi:hypothetical protein
LAEAALLPHPSSRADFLFFGQSFELFFDYRLFKRTTREMGLNSFFSSRPEPSALGALEIAAKFRVGGMGRGT